MSHSYLEEVSQSNFESEEFVERLAWRITGGSIKSEAFDTQLLKDGLQNVLEELTGLQGNIDEKANQASKDASYAESKFKHNLLQLRDKTDEVVGGIQKLDEMVSSVSTKVVHLGDQLESVTTPRSRALQAYKLMSYFHEFLTADNSNATSVFNDVSKLKDAADVILKLNQNAQELPGEKFEQARNGIAKKYDAIERSLIDDFVKAQDIGDRATMKELANILSNFKGYNQCIDAFIEESQRGMFLYGDVFTEIVPLCHKTYILIEEVFTTPDTVMGKFIINLYDGKLQEHIQEKLSDKRDSQKYLTSLFHLYSKTSRVSQDLATFKLGNDSTFLNKLTKKVFAKYLDNYISVETVYLREKSADILQKYYESINHQKKAIGGIQELRARINAGVKTDSHSKETLLSEEVAINLLQEAKTAFRRCQALSAPSRVAKNALLLADILIHYLCTDHIDYALEVALQAITVEPKQQVPELLFLDVVRQTNAIYHLFDKLYSDSLLPLVSSSAKHADCLQQKKETMESFELKIDNGIDRTISAMINWIRYTLSSEQKKTDFKPDTDEITQLGSPACMRVVRFLTDICLPKTKQCIDGKNLDAVLTEIGCRFHRVVYEHLQKFEYSSVGAMLVICDVNEYRKCVKDLHVPLITQLFETLHAMCNLLVVVPDNLKQVCSGEQLTSLDKTVLNSFIQLRADYKTAKLSTVFK